MKRPSSRAANLLVLVWPVVVGGLMVLAARIGGFWAAIGLGVAIVAVMVVLIRKKQKEIATTSSRR